MDCFHHLNWCVRFNFSFHAVSSLCTSVNVLCFHFVGSQFSFTPLPGFSTLEPRYPRASPDRHGQLDANSESSTIISGVSDKEKIETCTLEPQEVEEDLEPAKKKIKGG